MDKRGSEISMGARVAAAAALAIAGIVLVVALGGALSGGDSGPTPGSGGSGQSATSPEVQSGPASYEVEEGDTLSAISEQTGVSVTEIEELNPGLDPQALAPGQELRLR